MSGRLAVGMYTTVGPRCGIADYARELIGALAGRVDVVVTPICPGSLNPFAQVAAGRALSRGDVAHIQHTYGFFGVDQLTYTLLIRTLVGYIRTPLVLTAHTVRDTGPSRFEGGAGSALANAVGAPAWLDVKTFARAQAVIVHAALHKERLVSRGLPADRVHVIPPAVPPRVTVNQAGVVSFRRRMGIADGTPVVGVAGFLDASKGYTVLLEAVAGLSSKPAVLLAGGPRRAHETSTMESIRVETERLGLRDRVRVTGYLEPTDFPIAVEAMDLVVVPYDTEDSVSYSLHKALGQWRPVVATDVRPLREVQERAGCLALVPPRDSKALGGALDRLLADVRARERMAAGARAYAGRETPAVAAMRTHEVYDAVRKAVA